MKTLWKTPTFLFAAVAIALLLTSCSSDQAQNGSPAPDLAKPSVTSIPSTSAPRLDTSDPTDFSASWLGQTGVAFVSPDKNISCGIGVYTDTKVQEFGCVIKKYTFTDPPALAGTQDPCGGGFLSYDGKAATTLCGGEPNPYPGTDPSVNVKVLPYGSSLMFNGVFCTDFEASGITCIGGKHGFMVDTKTFSTF
jgi:hypothetical protein